MEIITFLKTAILSGNGADRNAFWEAYYMKYVIKLAWRLRCKYKHLDSNGATDFVHDAFDKLLKKNIDYFDSCVENDDKMEGLLWTTIKNCYINSRIRCEKRSTESLQAVENFRHPFICQLPYDGDITYLLRQISPKQAEALKLSVLEGYTYQEIADMNDENLSTVKMQIKRAKEKLRKLYILLNKVVVN